MMLSRQAFHGRASLFCEYRKRPGPSRYTTVTETVRDGNNRSSVDTLRGLWHPFLLSPC